MDKVAVRLDRAAKTRLQKLAKTNNKRISGVGEEGIAQIAPAIAQAVFKITGKRIRSLPIGKQDMSWA